MSFIPCTEPHYIYGSVFLAEPPKSDRAPVLYCPKCLGFGTVVSDQDDTCEGPQD